MTSTGEISVGLVEDRPAVEVELSGNFTDSHGRAVSPAPFRRIPYSEAMLRYASDKPDLRNPLEISEATETFRGSGFRIFAGMIDGDPNVRVRAIPAPCCVLTVPLSESASV